METDIVTCPNCGKRNRVPAAAAGKPRCANCHQWLPGIAAAGDGDVADVAEKSSVPVLVDMWAPWCGPCRMVAPALEQLASEFAGKVWVAKVNVDENPVTSDRFRIQSIASLLIFKDGREIDRLVGAQPKSEIARRLQRVKA